MRKILVLFLLMFYFVGSAQIHLEYISEPSDSMALINKNDVDLINNVFNEKNILDSLNVLNEQIILNLETQINIQDSIIVNQDKTIKNSTVVIHELENQNARNVDFYLKELKKEKRSKFGFQITAVLGLIIIIIFL